MSTQAQVTANRINAQSSTGPTTDEGKSNSAKNGTTHGLFSRHDVIGKDEIPAYEELTAALQSELAPKTTLEQIFVEEIRHATWCLRRCSKVESELLSPNLDPLEAQHPIPIRIRASVERARAQAHRLLRQSMAELRKLQTDRQYAADIFPDESDLGLADWRAIAKAHADRTRTELRQRKLDETLAGQAPAQNTERTQSQPNMTARNAKCPCGSGEKHKRCCGKDAPPVLQAREMPHAA